VEQADQDALRQRLGQLMADGLETEWRDRAYTSTAVNGIVARLQALAANDYAGKLQIAGFTSQPYVLGEDDIQQACETCMYYATHRQFCELPELQMPVRPAWSCRLWRI
jgi:hypothetical protein